LNGHGRVERSARADSGAVATLVLGILGVVGVAPLGIVSIVMGRRAIRRVERTGGEGYGIARAGVILGWIAAWLMIGSLFLVPASSCSGPALPGSVPGSRCGPSLKLRRVAGPAGVFRRGGRWRSAAG